ncbi:helix-turn-helix transcriptional regulator [Leucobacter sp. HY1910]
MAREKVEVRGSAQDVLEVLGQQVRIARVERGWTQKHLGAVCGASERTISMIERGHPSVAVGNVINAALAAGVPLFQEEDPVELARMRFRGEEKIALIPKRVAAQSEVSRDLRDF